MSTAFKSPEADPVALAAISAEDADTTNVHGITDTSKVQLLDVAQTRTKALTITPDSDAVALTLTSNAGSSISRSSLDAGPGTAYGAPSGTLTLADSGVAGNLNGAYQYAYAETDPMGQTTLSAVASITVASKKVQVTVPLPRRGISGRKLYRTVAGGSTFKLVSSLGSGGVGYFHTVYMDNVADGSLGATAPTTDTTGLYNLHVKGDVKYLRTGPAVGTGVGDLTMLTASPTDNNAWSLDSYGSIIARAASGHCFEAIHTGDPGGASHLAAYYADVSSPQDVSVDATATKVFGLQPQGDMAFTPQSDRLLLDFALVSGASQSVARIKKSGDANTRWTVDPNGKMTWGDGTASPDVSFERISAIRGKLTGSLDVTGSILTIGPGATGSSSHNLYVGNTGSSDTDLFLGTGSWGAVQLKATGTSPGLVSLMTTNGTPLGFGANGVIWQRVTTTGNVIVGKGALATPAEMATSATDGFLHIPTTNGAPTAAPPTTVTGAVPICFDRANDKLYVYRGGWKSTAALT